MATEGTPAPAPAQPYGEIYDLGYRHYDGPRLGRGWALRALTVYSVKRGLGIRKKWTSKLIPIFLYIAAYTPALIVAGIAAFVGDAVDFDYDDLNFFIENALLVYAAALAPEMLCDDRRENVLALYFSRALTRVDYLLAKVSAMAFLMLTIAFGPLLLLFLAFGLQADDPLAWFGDNLGDLGKIALYGTLVSAFYAAIALSVAAYTNRKGIASGVFIGGMIFLTAIANALFEAVESDARRFILFVSPLDMVRAVSVWLFGDIDSLDVNQVIREGNLPGYAVVAGVLAVVAIAAGIMYRRYLAEE